MLSVVNQMVVCKVRKSLVVNKGHKHETRGLLGGKRRMNDSVKYRRVIEYRRAVTSSGHKVNEIVK